jgi:hypothetical protein
MITINGFGIQTGVLCMPAYGAWHMRATVDADAIADVTGACSIAIEGGATLTGTSYRVGESDGRFDAWIVGGAGRLGIIGAELVGKFYSAAPSKTIATDIATESGETLSSTSDAATLATLQAKWMRKASYAGSALGTLTTALGVGWRLLDDGSIWIGPETWPAYSADVDVIDTCGMDDRIVVADETLGLRPGMSLDGRNVSYVQHTISPELLRTEAFLA